MSPLVKYKLTFPNGLEVFLNAKSQDDALYKMMEAFNDLQTRLHIRTAAEQLGLRSSRV